MKGESDFVNRIDQKHSYLAGQDPISYSFENEGGLEIKIKMKIKITIMITIKRKEGKGDKLLDLPRSDSEKGAMDFEKWS